MLGFRSDVLLQAPRRGMNIPQQSLQLQPVCQALIGHHPIVAHHGHDCPRFVMRSN
jgi:hypothetical protein